MTLASSIVFHVFITPKQLREIADLMESRMPQLKVGDDCVMVVLHIVESTERSTTSQENHPSIQMNTFQETLYHFSTTLL